MSIVDRLKKIDIDDIRGWPFSTLETIDQAIAEITRLQEENKRMKEALIYYATDEHYDEGDVPCHIYIIDDHGRTARTALATTGGE